MNLPEKNETSKGLAPFRETKSRSAREALRDSKQAKPVNQQAKKLLKDTLKTDKNVNSFEKYIWKWSLEESQQKNNEGILVNQDADITEIYTTILYETLFELKKQSKITPVFSILKEGKVMWKSPYFNNLHRIQEEQDNFLLNPFEVEEGVQECLKCNSKRTFSYQSQTRSADEGMTTFVQCVSCGNKWKQ